MTGICYMGTAIVNLGSARIELGFELKTPDHEIHQVMPTFKHHIARQGANIIEKGLTSDQQFPEGSETPS
jgi:hypothetical protein